jgi:hypothetical protein
MMKIDKFDVNHIHDWAFTSRTSFIKALGKKLRIMSKSGVVGSYCGQCQCQCHFHTLV